MYSKLPNLVIGFHGCDRTTCERMLTGGEGLKASENKYDWLGNGIYFWEQNLERAWRWARLKKGADAAVIGAVIDLGYCLNLMDSSSNKILRTGYEILSKKMELLGLELPQNKKRRKGGDELLRHLDCAVIQQAHEYNANTGEQSFDSVRGLFTEGSPVYQGAAILEETHVQLCVRNPNCIKGYFLPREQDVDFIVP